MKKIISIVVSACIAILISAIAMNIYMPKYSSETKEYKTLEEYSDYIASMSLLVNSEKANFDLETIYQDFPDLQYEVFLNSERGSSKNQGSIIVILKSIKKDFQLESEYPIKIENDNTLIGIDFCIRNYYHANKNRAILVLSIVIFIVITGLMWIIIKIKENKN